MKRGGKKMMRGGMAKKPMAMKRGGKAGPKGYTKKVKLPDQNLQLAKCKF